MPEAVRSVLKRLAPWYHCVDMPEAMRSVLKCLALWYHCVDMPEAVRSVLKCLALWYHCVVLWAEVAIVSVGGCDCCDVTLVTGLPGQGHFICCPSHT